MIEIIGYRVNEQPIYVGRNSIIYRAVKMGAKLKSFIIKVPTTKLPNKKGANKLAHEFSIRQKIQSSYAMQNVELAAHPIYGYVLIEEDESRSVLSELIPESGFDVAAFIKLAIQLIEGLGDIHRSQVIHKDIKPANIVVTEAGVPKYIDFGSASLTQLKHYMVVPHISTGTLNYISPEQTGRVNRLTDYRSDFYSIGITFYQMLCGKVPFSGKDTLELIYSHLAKQPVPLHLVKTTVPEALSNIVLKLLNKDADERYQSTSGILNDLKRCANELAEKGEISNFVVGQCDFSEHFYLPQKLYGRENELLQLRAAINRVRTGKVEMCMIAGQAGTGKSALVNELISYISEVKGYYLSGKFDQLNRNVAYSAIKEAFQMFIRQLTIADPYEVIKWKARWKTALGNNAQVMIDLIPELELILDKQEPVPILDAIQTKNRFEMVFQNFICVIAQSQHPLLLFLDDWQWADSASMNLIQSLLTNPGINNFLLVGAYRNNDAEIVSALLQKTNLLKMADVRISEITLEVLDENSVNQWIADALQATLEATHFLAELIYQKTDGNPFFMKAFLQAIYDNRLLTFSEGTGWVWEIESIRRFPATENVVELMTHQIKKLPRDAQDTLKMASCLGHRFTLEALQAVTRKSLPQLYVELPPAIAMGLIMQVEETFEFSHDRIQEATYQLIPLEERNPLHLSIGRTLLALLPVDPPMQALFEAVDHINKGRSLVIDKNEQLTFVALNLNVAKKAKLAIAYANSLIYLYQALDYIGALEVWKTNYALAFEIYYELAEVEYLNNNFNLSAQYVELLIANAKTPLEKALVYNFVIVQKTLQAQYKEAIDAGLLALNLLNVELRLENVNAALQDELHQIKLNLQNRSMDALLQAEIIQDPILKEIIKLLYNLAAPAFITDQPLYMLLSARMVNLTLLHGNTSESCMAYSIYGMLLSSVLDDIPLGYEFGLLGIQLSNKFKSPANQCRSNFLLANFILHWMRPLKEVIPYIHQAEQAGLEAGEFQYLGYLSQYKATYFFYSGSALPDILAELAKLSQVSYNANNYLVKDIISAVRLVSLYLASHAQDDMVFSDARHHEAYYEEQWGKNKSNYAIANYLILKAKALYIHHHFEEALKMAVAAEAYLPYIPGHIAVANHNFFHSLILTALYRNVDEETKRNYWQQLVNNQQKLHNWARHSTANFLHKYKLVQAEMARIKNDVASASELYDEAIDLLEDSMLIQEAAMAHELAATFYLDLNKRNTAQGALIRAYRYYQNWGAYRKVELLMKNYASLLKPFVIEKPPTFSLSGETTISTHNLTLLDLASILKASQSISSAIDLERLLINIMHITVESAGAQGGAFLLVDGDKLSVQAEYHIITGMSTLQALPLEDWQGGARLMVEYVRKIKTSVILENALLDPQFKFDPYVSTHKLKSVLCMPIMKQGELLGILYLENNLATNLFTQDRVQILNLLAGQMAISLENAKSFRNQLKATKQIADIQRVRAEEAESYKTRQAQFIDTVCHEIRNPLAGILGSVDIAKAALKALTDSSKTQAASTAVNALTESLENIQACAVHQKVILDDVLSLSRLEANNTQLEIVTFNLNELIKSTVKMYEANIARKNLQLVRKLPEEALIIKSDPNRVKAIIINLMLNAIKFTQAGYIGLTVILKEKSATNMTISIEVEDTGVGLTLEEKEHIFDRFTNASPKISSEYEGSGLGLSICKQSTILLDGSLSVESEKGRGSKFSLTFTCEVPSQEEIKVLLNHSDERQLTIPAKSTCTVFRILVVEDNSINQKILMNYVKQAGYECDVASNGREAIEKHEQRHYHLIFMDLEMPIMGGVAAAQAIRDKERSVGILQVPIIALTGYTRDEYTKEALRAGMNEYFTKPFKKADVLQCIAKYASAKENQAMLSHVSVRSTSEHKKPLAQVRLFRRRHSAGNLPSESSASFQSSKEGKSKLT